MNQLLLFTVLFLFATSSLFGQANRIGECAYPNEKISIDTIHSKRNEKYDPAAAKVFTFEDNFRDTISIWVADKLIFKKYMKTELGGDLADRASIKVRPKTEITIRTVEQGCARFTLKKGYKYIYIMRDINGKWGVTYANYKRYYY